MDPQSQESIPHEISVGDVVVETVSVSTPASKRSVFEWISRTIFTLVVFLLPFFILPIAGIPIEVGKSGLLSVGVLVAFALWLLSRLEKGEIHTPKGIVFLGAGVLVFSYLLSALFSGGVGHSFFGLGYETTTTLSIIVFVLAMFLSTLYFRGTQFFARLLKGLIWGHLIVFVIFVLRVIMPSFFAFVLQTPTTTLLGKWNDFGIFSGLMVAISLVTLDLDRRIPLSRKLVSVSAVVALIGVVLVNLPLVWYLLAFISLAIVVYNISGRFSFTTPAFSSRVIMSLSTVVFVLSLVGIFFAGTRQDGSPQVLSSIITKIESSLGIVSLEARPSWEATVKVSQGIGADRLILGVGPNNFDRQWRLDRPDVVNESLFWNNDFSVGYGYITSSFVLTGILGVLGWTLLLFGFFFLSMRGMYATGRNGEHFELILGLFLLGTYLWFSAIFYIPDMVLLALAFIFTGILVGLLSEWGMVRSARITFASLSRARFLGIFGTVLVGICAFFGAYVSAQKLYAVTLYREGLTKLNASNDPNGAAALISKAASLSNEDLYYRSLAEVGIVQFSRVLLRSGSNVTPQVQAQFTELFRAAYGNADKATKIDPKDFQNFITLGKVYEAVVPVKIQGSHDAAEKAYMTAAQLDPKSPVPYLSLARLEFTAGNNTKANQYITQGLGLKSNYAELIFLSSQIAAKEGNLSQAIKAAEAAVVLAPGDIGVWFQVGVLKYNNRDYSGAALALEQAVSINTNYSNARYFLGLSYDKLGQSAKALDEFKKVLVLNPDNADVKHAIANLEAGRAALQDAPPPTPIVENPEPSDKKTKK
jgi:tetratricopeptide (TPR) repeat protein